MLDESARDGQGPQKPHDIFQEQCLDDIPPFSFADKEQIPLERNFFILFSFYKEAAVDDREALDDKKPEQDVEAGGQYHEDHRACLRGMRQRIDHMNEIVRNGPSRDRPIDQRKNAVGRSEFRDLSDLAQEGVVDRSDQIGEGRIDAAHKQGGIRVLSDREYVQKAERAHLFGT